MSSFRSVSFGRIAGYVVRMLIVSFLPLLQLAHHWIYRACRFPQSPWIKTPEEWETERRAALAACLGLSVGILNQMLMLPQDEILLYSPDSTHLFYCYGSFLLEKVRYSCLSLLHAIVRSDAVHLSSFSARACSRRMSLIRLRRSLSLT